MDEATTEQNEDTQQTQAADTAGEHQSQEHSSAADTEMSLEDYKAALAKTRKEAARIRLERNELRPLIDRVDAQDKALREQKAAYEDKIAQLTQDNRRMVMDKARLTAAAEFGVDADLLRGSSEEEITEHAKALRAAIDKAMNKQVPFAPTVPGENAGGLPEGGQDFLRDLLNSR